jgi:hypothetical protein
VDRQGRAKDKDFAYLGRRDRICKARPCNSTNRPSGGLRARRLGVLRRRAHRCEGLDFDESTAADPTQKPAARQFHSKL